MEKVYCKYHPSRPARWRCEPCRVNFCTACTSPESMEGAPPCPLCGQQTSSLGAGNLIQPFWYRIPRFFLFPLHHVPLVFILILTGLGMLASDTLVGMLYLLAISIVLLKYAFIVLEDTAQGYLKPRPITFNAISNELELPFKQLALIFFIVTINLKVLEYFGFGPFVLMAVLSITVFPAAIMILAVEHGFFKAINPLLLFVTIKRIGFAYLIMCLFLAFLLSGAGIASDMLGAVLPGKLSVAVSAFIIMYFVLIIYNMMGYVIYQYHEQLGHSVIEKYIDSDADPEEQATDPRYRHVDILLQEGKSAEAEQKLIETIQQNPGEFSAREKLHRFHVATRNEEGLLKHSADYIVRLLHANKPSEAMRIYMEASNIAFRIKPGTARERHELATLLKTNGQSRSALGLLNNLHVEFPAYEGIPAAYLLVAKIMFEYFGEEKKALQVMDFIKKKYPGHPLEKDIDEYYKVVEKMVGAGQPSA